MTHYVVIHALMVSWYLKRRPSNPTDDFMMDLDPWKSPTMVEVVEEAHEPLGMSKNPLSSGRILEGFIEPTLDGFMILQPLLGHGACV